MVEMLDLIAKIAIGAATGCGYSIYGYFKSRVAHGEDFDEKSMIQTVIVGACVGGVAGEMGMSYEQGWDYAASVGFITGIEWAKKILWSKLHPSA